MDPAVTHSVFATGRPLALPFDIPNPFSAGADEVMGWVVDGINKAINTFFGDLVKAALNPLLRLLGKTLLATPEPSSLPRVGELWENSREIAVAVYALLILLAAIVVMAYETVQTRHSIKEIAPRIVVGFLAANMSLLLAGQAVTFANALSAGVMSDGVDPTSAASTLSALIVNSITNGGIFLIFIGIALACILLALLVCYVIRVVLTVILIAAAPLALMCLALPQTEGIARWWCRAFAGVLTIQLAQSLTLITALNVFLAKGGFTLFGPTPDGLINLIVTLALLYVLFKIPFWILHSIKIGNGKSFLGSAVKGVIAYKTLGMIGLRGGEAAAAGRARLPGGPGGNGGSPRGNRPSPNPSGPNGSSPRRGPNSTRPNGTGSNRTRTNSSGGPGPNRSGGSAQRSSGSPPDHRSRSPLTTRPASGASHAAASPRTSAMPTGSSYAAGRSLIQRPSPAVLVSQERTRHNATPPRSSAPPRASSHDAGAWVSTARPAERPRPPQVPAPPRPPAPPRAPSGRAVPVVPTRQAAPVVSPVTVPTAARTRSFDPPPMPAQRTGSVLAAPGQVPTTTYRRTE